MFRQKVKKKWRKKKRSAKDFSHRKIGRRLFNVTRFHFLICTREREREGESNGETMFPRKLYEYFLYHSENCVLPLFRDTTNFRITVSGNQRKSNLKNELIFHEDKRYNECNGMRMRTGLE